MNINLHPDRLLTSVLLLTWQAISIEMSSISFDLPQLMFHVMYVSL